MELFRRNRRLISWLASMAIVLNALAPAVSHAMASIQGQSAPWMEICSVSGTKFVPMAFDLSPSHATDQADSSKTGDSQPMSMQHCPYCLAQAGNMAVLTDYGFELAQTDLSYSLPALFYQSHHPLFVWAASSPRAPPSIS
jgi:hypothetical protein